MKKKSVAALLVGGSLILCGLTSWATEGAAMKGGDAEIKKGDFVIACNSGKECGKFQTAVKDAKDCKCGAETDKLHVLKVEGEVAVVCPCGGGCACELNANNPYLCGCGSPVKVLRIVK